jgi:two-component system C4-dicarboxylate transport sensor histidine kinase DctB
MEANNPSANWLERANQLALAAQLLPNTIHDLNNALQIITGSAELLDLATGAEEVEVRRRGLAIRTQASRATMLLNELKAFTRDGTDHVQRLPVRPVIERALALRRYSLTKFGIESSLQGEEAALGNARDLLQIVLNTLINAEQALAGRPGGKIAIEIVRSAEQVLVTISDNGPGLSDEAARSLFRPSASPDARGRLGIGLTVSRSLAERQGGALAYAAGRDGGCAFTLTLSAAEPSAATLASAAPIPSSPR